MSASQFPPLESKPSTKRCSNCSSLMSLYNLPGHYGQTIDIDVCLNCNALWFDQWESSQLSPDGVVALFQLIHQRGGTSSSAGSKLNEGLRCVSCGDGMKLVNDRVKNTRFVYQSCRHGHGRLTTFYNFLSEKQFVRELTQAERAKLCASVKQVQCSSCGAPVDLGKNDACGYCRAPVSVFDRDAAKKAIEHYLKERQRHVPTTAPPQNYGYSQQHQQRGWDTWDSLYAADLASDLLWALGRAASRGLARGGAATTGVVAGSALADSGTVLGNVPGGLMDTLGSTAASGAPLTATEALFGSASALSDSSGMASAASSLLSDGSGIAGNALSGASDVLPSATEALFGSGASAAQDLFSSSSAGLADTASGALDSVSDFGGDVAAGIGESVTDVASSAGDGIVDLVSDGIGSLITSIFD